MPDRFATHRYLYRAGLLCRGPKARLAGGWAQQRANPLRGGLAGLSATGASPYRLAGLNLPQTNVSLAVIRGRRRGCPGAVTAAKRSVVKALVPFLALVLAAPAMAQPDAPPGVPPSMASRLRAERPSAVEPGLYSAGDRLTFTLQPDGTHYLLRFAGSSETFVLNVERGSLGAKLMKYDTGTTALRVSVWGGLTLYTRDAPQGIPATYQAPSQSIQPRTISAAELITAFGDETGHITYAQNIALKFSADPAVLSSDAETRGRAFDALINAASGIERFLTDTPAARAMLAKRINSVKLAEGGKPTIALSGQTLLVSFVPGDGHQGHASSLAIQQELSKLLAVTAPAVATK
jgi:hypothetical protein